MLDLGLCQLALQPVEIVRRVVRHKGLVSVQPESMHLLEADHTRAGLYERMPHRPARASWQEYVPSAPKAAANSSCSSGRVRPRGGSWLLHQKKLERSGRSGVAAVARCLGTRGRGVEC